jgi:hypothetical protein
MKEETWRALEGLFSEHPIMKAGEVDSEEIAEAEHVIGIALDADYKEFVRRYGGAIVGPFRIFGLRRAVPMGKDDGSFIEVTQSFRKQRWPGVDTWAVVSMDQAGNPVGLDAEGKIWIYDHDARAAQIIAADFETYLRKQCLQLHV